MRVRRRSFFFLPPELVDIKSRVFFEGSKSFVIMARGVIDREEEKGATKVDEEKRRACGSNLVIN